MVKQSDDDLFAESTMSFGEHLEELRGSLARALAGLLVGFLIGLLLANFVVEWIQTPLKHALEKHYINKAETDITSEYKAQGETVSPQISKFIQEKRFVYENIYVEAGEFTRIGKLMAEESASDTPASDQTEPDSAPSEETPEQDTVAEEVPLRILGEEIPSPQPVMVATRIWRPIHSVVKALNAHEAFMIWLKAAFVAGLIISSPYIFYELWVFVAAGLYPHEKSYVYIYLPFSLILFLAGAATAFFFVFDYVLDFLFSFNRAMNIDPDPRISEWLGFVLFLPLGFGVAFQLPLVMLFLHRIGIFSIKAYLDKWRIAILVIFVASMLLTPADPISMLLMAAPLSCLYFLGIGLCKWMPRNRSPFSEGYDP